ncbi:hypothetical protein [Maricaulis sp.]|uniref:hypothetical protein n=1 Tax=Maricaulis sp. TaxID=1486257 RepID=UPI003A8DCA78
MSLAPWRAGVIVALPGLTGIERCEVYDAVQQFQQVGMLAELSALTGNLSTKKQKNLHPSQNLIHSSPA